MLKKLQIISTALHGMTANPTTKYKNGSRILNILIFCQQALYLVCFMLCVIFIVAYCAGSINGTDFARDWFIGPVATMKKAEDRPSNKQHQQQQKKKVSAAATRPIEYTI